MLLRFPSNQIIFLIAQSKTIDQMEKKQLTTKMTKNDLRVLVMAALRSRCGHYIFVLWLLLSSFFLLLISAVADWMSTILPHMLWP